MSGVTIPLWQQNKQRADTYLPEAFAIVRQVAPQVVKVEVASDWADQHEATDLVLKVDGGRWALRLRFEDCPADRRDLTLRYSLPSGVPTEYQKIKAGFGDYYLYGWDGFREWMVIDLGKFRADTIIDRGRLGPPNHNDSNRWLYWECDRLYAAGLLVAHHVNRLPPSSDDVVS